MSALSWYGVAAAQDSASAAPVAKTDSTPAPNHVEALLSGVKLSGYAEASYQTSTRTHSSALAGRLYDRFNDQFTLGAVEITLDKPYKVATLSAGVHTNVLFGQNASVIQSRGLRLGEQGDIPQLYVTLNIPTPNGNGVQLRAGKMVTLMGLEVIETVANPNWSEGNQFVYLENFTALGVSAEYRFNRRLDAELRLINGWDVVQDNNRGKSVMARVGVAPDSATSIAVVGFAGPEETNDSRALRAGIDVLASRTFGSHTTVWFQGDMGGEQRNDALPDPSRSARWWAIGGWLSHDVTSRVGLAFRGDYMNDEEGARTSGVLGFPVNTGLRLGTATATVNLRAWPHALVRPELRYDRANHPAFDGHADQLTFALSVASLY